MTYGYLTVHEGQTFKSRHGRIKGTWRAWAVGVAGVAFEFICPGEETNRVVWGWGDINQDLIATADID